MQAERFHLNGHIIGFCPQTQKLELPQGTPTFTLTVTGLPYQVKEGWQLHYVHIDHLLQTEHVNSEEILDEGGFDEVLSNEQAVPRVSPKLATRYTYITKWLVFVFF